MTRRILICGNRKTEQFQMRRRAHPKAGEVAGHGGSYCNPSYLGGLIWL
jgi:hypothetical protein